MTLNDFQDDVNYGFGKKNELVSNLIEKDISR